MDAVAVLNLENKHKNRLQEFAQRASIAMPVYRTINEGGSQHQPQFRSTVDVDGMSFVSPCVFVRRKEAEQYAAKFALESILTKTRQEGVPLINNDAAFCKTILHEYAAKMKLELPKYTTSISEGLLPIFITTVVFDGKTYSGDAGRSKREAEQLGARAVIHWILGQSDKSIAMAEIIKSKAKLFNAFLRFSRSVVPHDNNVPLEVSGETIANEKNMHTESTNGKLPEHSILPAAAEHSILPAAEHSILPAAEHPSLPAAGNPKEPVRGVCSGTVGEINTAPTIQNNNQAAAATNEPVNSVSNYSCPGSVIEIKEEGPSENPPMLPCNLQSPNPSTSGKRPRKKNRRGRSSKKIRTNE